VIDRDLIEYVSALDTAAAGRVYTGNAPQNTPPPYVVLARVSETSERTLDGTVILNRATFALNAYGATYEDAHAVAAALKTALDGYRGAMGETNVMFARRESFGPDLSEVDGDKTLRHLPSEFTFAYL
jgi:hypothetical protein